MWVIGTHSIVIHLAWTSCLSQFRDMSMCRSFVENCGIAFVRIQMACWLSPYIFKLCLGSKSMELKKRFHQASSFAVCIIASSSASVLDVVTVFCFVDLQSIGPPKRLNRYPSVLRRDGMLSPYAASLAQTNGNSVSCAESSIAMLYVVFRYTIACSAACWCAGDGFFKNSDSLAAVRA